jgi:hypothetical protein
MRAAVVGVVAGDRQVATGPVIVEWTDDIERSTRVSPQVAHYTGQTEMATAIDTGLDALQAGDQDLATAKLGRAVQLATESGHQDTVKLLTSLVDVLDPGAGTVRLRDDASALDEEIAGVRSNKTVRFGSE